MIDLSLGNLVAWAIQVAAIGTAGVLLPFVLRITSPRARLAYLRAVLLACLVLPLVQPWVPAPVNGLAAVDSASLSADQALVIGRTSGLDGAGQPAAPVGPAPALAWPVEVVAGVVYLAGLTLRLGWMGLGFVVLARLRRTSVPLVPRPAPVDDAARLVGADAEFRVSTRVVRPVTFGLRRPLVLVPPGFEAFDTTQQTAIAAHELLHVARLDWLRTIGDELVLSIFWFHPALWWLVAQIHLSVELVVDRAVVQLVGARKPYLEALLKLAAAGPTPLLQPAAAFLKHGHLAERVALLVKEASMSRLRLVASFALVLAVMGAGGWYVVQAFPLTAAAEAMAAPIVSAPARADVELPALLPPPPAPAKSADPQSASGQATRPTVDPKAQQAKPGMPTPPPPPPPPGVGKAVPGPFDPVAWEKGVLEVQNLIAANPTRADLHLTLSVYYWERAYRDQALSAADKANFVSKGMQSIDRALSLKPDDIDSLLYKSLLLRLQASMEANATDQQSLIAWADKLRDKAVALRGIQNPWPAVPANAVRIGGDIKAPTKVKDVKPMYPATALRAQAQGVVIIEAVVGPDGKVQAARVMRSVPLLDQAALDAVTQWEFTPTLLNGAPVPVVITLTVNFTLSDGPGRGAGAGIGAGVGGGVAGGVAQADDTWAKTVAPEAIRVGKDIKPPTRIKDVRPVYPAEAKEAGAQGVVIIEAVIGANGAVTAARVLRSIPPLDQAALDAVNQWVFTPTLLNGTPVPVIMTVTVNFTLR